MSFDVVRIVGSERELLVSVRYGEDGFDCLAPPDPDDLDGPYESLGTEEQIPLVAGIIRQRVGVTV